MESLITLPTILFEEFTAIRVSQATLEQPHFSQVAASVFCHSWLRLQRLTCSQGHPIATFGLYPCEKTAMLKTTGRCLIQVAVRLPRPGEIDPYMVQEFVLDVHITGITKPGKTNWSALDLDPLRHTTTGRNFIRVMSRALEKKK